MGVLKHHGNIFSQIIPFNLGNGDLIQCDRSLVNIVKAVDQICNGGLSCAGRTYKSNFLSRLRVKGNVLQNSFIRMITEGHML